MKSTFILILSFFTIYAHAQNLSIDWVKTFGGNNSDFSKKLLIDQQGNIYTLGTYRLTVDFDPGPGITNKTSNGQTDIFIQKLDNNGNFIWVQTFGGPGVEEILDADFDHNNNIILSGYFADSVDFDFGATTDIKVSNGLGDAYITKITAGGNYLWTSTFGGTVFDICARLCINSTDDISLTGNFYGTVDFNPGPGVANRTAANSNVFVLQLNSNGNFNWVKTIDGTASSLAQANDLIVDANDNLYLTGFFTDTVDIDPGIGSNLIYAGNGNIYILKLNNAGDFIRLSRFASNAANQISMRCLLLDNFGNLYVGGSFIGSVDFNPGPAIFNQSSIGQAAFILKLDTIGNFKSVRKMGGAMGPVFPDVIINMVSDAQGNITACGSLLGYEDFDPGSGIHLVGNQLWQNISGFYMQLDSAGNLNWAKGIEGVPPVFNNESSVNDIVQSAQGDFYITGYFWDSTDFDPDSGSIIISSINNSPDAFVLKLKDCSPKYGIDVINSCTPITWIDGQTYIASNFTALDTISSSNGCDSIVTLNLTITTVDTSVIRSNNTLTSNASAATYQWVNCSNNHLSIAGATNQSFTPLSNGSYAVIINQNGCTDTSNCFTFTTLAVNNNATNEIFKVFPNPTTNYLTLQSHGKSLTFSLYNSLGQLVKQKIIIEQQKDVLIYIKELPAGNYTYAFSNKQSVLSRGKLILK